MSTILQEVLAWSQQLPTWQSDAIARLLAKHKLAKDDVDDLFALLKAHFGIVDSKGRTPNPLTADQIPAPGKSTDQVRLVAMKNMRHVNAIAENQRLPFGATGLTVIYGDNGSGKSGYSRVLKRACRARDQSEPILPNAYLSGAKTGNAEATFELLKNGESQEFVWTADKPAPAALSALAIFDSRCARAYLDQEDDFSYVPYGLDIFEGLASLCKDLKAMLDAEYMHNAPDVSVFALLQGHTAVGQLIESISAKTKVTDVETLATLTQEQLKRCEQLENSLKENNPKEKANELRVRARRIAAIATNVASQAQHVTPAVISKLQGHHESYRNAHAAAQQAAEQFAHGEELLKGTGGDAWRELFDAARRFAVESHPHKEFPNLGADSRCPLCQQPLSDGANRLIRFDKFIKEATEKTVRERKAAFDTERTKFIGKSLSINLDDVTYSEIEALDSSLAADVRKFEGDLLNKQKAVKQAMESGKWGDEIEEISSPVDRLKALAQLLDQKAKDLEQAADEQQRAAMQKEYEELSARVKLGTVKDSVLAAISKYKHQATLNRCMTAIKTTPISLKAAELTEKVVSKQLADALNREFKALGVGELSVELHSRLSKGKTLHKLKLNVPQSRAPGEVLSEGEQRAIAIGSFLAEISLSDTAGGIVFDDPVSSLDHRRRERVAKRLAAEGEKRQVIVFTHDIYFLCVVAEEADAVGVPITTQSVMRRPEGYGVADPDLPFEGKGTTKRIGTLKQQHQAIEKFHKSGDEAEFRRQTVDAYRLLRLAWERAVEEVLFQGVVLRFRKGVETQKLAGVMVEDDDYDRVYKGMTKCSTYAHDKALLGGIAVPDPDELWTDIMDLENWRQQIQKRSEQTGKKRKSSPMLQTPAVAAKADTGS